MKKWPVTLSTTEPFNYIGIVKVRQGNKNSEVLQATIIENGDPLDLSGCTATIQTVIGKHPVERACKITDQKKGIVEYVFDEYTMQESGRQTANIAFYKGDEFIASSQDFSYFVIRAVSQTEGEMGSYWQTVNDLIDDMTDYINAGQGDFDTWFDSVKDILSSIDPGGVLLNEVVEARKDLSGVRHTTISARLQADFEWIQQQLKDELYTLEESETDALVILQDDVFSQNHAIVNLGAVNAYQNPGALLIGSVSTTPSGTFYFEKVGDLDG